MKYFKKTAKKASEEYHWLNPMAYKDWAFGNEGGIPDAWTGGKPTTGAIQAVTGASPGEGLFPGDQSSINPFAGMYAHQPPVPKPEKIKHVTNDEGKTTIHPSDLDKKIGGDAIFKSLNIAQPDSSGFYSGKAINNIMSNVHGKIKDETKGFVDLSGSVTKDHIGELGESMVNNSDFNMDDLETWRNANLDAKTNFILDMGKSTQGADLLTDDQLNSVQDNIKELRSTHDINTSAIIDSTNVANQNFAGIKKGGSLKFFKKAVAIDTSSHFLERLFGRPKVKKSFGQFENTFATAGGHDRFLEDIPELKQLLFYKGKQRLLYTDKETGAKYILDFMQDKETGKHKLVVVTGMEDYMNSNNTVDITDKINLLSRKAR